MYLPDVALLGTAMAGAVYVVRIMSLRFNVALKLFSESYVYFALACVVIAVRLLEGDGLGTALVVGGAALLFGILLDRLTRLVDLLGDKAQLENTMVMTRRR